MKKILYFFCVIGLSLTLKGCHHGSSMTTTTQLTGRGWARPPEPYKPSDLYCYQTLGQPVCYKEPLRDSDMRLIDFYHSPKVQPSQEVLSPFPRENMIVIEPLAPHGP